MQILSRIFISTLLLTTACSRRNQAPAVVTDLRLNEVQAVLDGIAGAPGEGVPDAVLNHALCLAVFPTHGAAEAGRPGTVSCRTGGGVWQRPIAVQLTGRSVATTSDLLVFLLNDSAQQALASGRMTLQGTAAGPVSGVTAVVAPVELRTAAVSYVRNEHRLLGANLEGEIQTDSSAHLPQNDATYQSSLVSFFNTITPNGIILHHTALFPGTEKLPTTEAEIDEYHASKGLDIECFGKEYHVAYHYLVLADGTVQQGRPERCEGAHAPGYNSYLGISVVGDFSTRDNPKGAKGPLKPSPQQIKAVVELCRRLRELYNIPLQHILRHSDVAPTKCPGDRFPYQTVLAEVSRGSKLDGDAHPANRRVHVPAKSRGSDEPFATFHLIDRQMSALQEQSSALQKMLVARHDGKTAPMPQRSTRQMRTSVAAIEKLTLRLRARYHSRPYAQRLFRRLQTRADRVSSALRGVMKAGKNSTALAATREVDRRIVALSLQYAAVSGGYGALHCEAGESSCCEPKRSESGARQGPADACRWMCTPKKSACRGFLGPDTLGLGSVGTLDNN
jgi:lipid-binding SYLF domain-containing protein